MSKPPYYIEPLAGPVGPEVLIPGIVAAKGIETYQNLGRLHDAYDQKVGVQRSAPAISGNDFKNSSSTSRSGTYIARRIRYSDPYTSTNESNSNTPDYITGNTTTAGTYIASRPGRPETKSYNPDDDEDLNEDPINLPYDDDDEMVDVPLDEGVRQRNPPRAQPSSNSGTVATDADDEEDLNQPLGVTLPRVPVQTIPLILGGATVVGGVLNQPPPPPPSFGQPQPTAPNPPPNIEPPPTVRPTNPPSDPTFPWTNPFDDLLSDPTVDDEENYHDRYRSGPQVIIKEARIVTTIPTLPAFTSGLALGMFVAAVAFN